MVISMSRCLGSPIAIFSAALFQTCRGEYQLTVEGEKIKSLLLRDKFVAEALSDPACIYDESDLDRLAQFFQGYSEKELLAFLPKGIPGDRAAVLRFLDGLFDTCDTSTMPSMAELSDLRLEKFKAWCRNFKDHPHSRRNKMKQKLEEALLPEVKKDFKSIDELTWACPDQETLLSALGYEQHKVKFNKGYKKDAQDEQRVLLANVMVPMINLCINDIFLNERIKVNQLADAFKDLSPAHSQLLFGSLGDPNTLFRDIVRLSAANLLNYERIRSSIPNSGGWVLYRASLKVQRLRAHLAQQMIQEHNENSVTRR